MNNSENFDPYYIRFDSHEDNPAETYPELVTQLVEVHQQLERIKEASADLEQASPRDIDDMSGALGRVNARFIEITGKEISALVNEREGVATPPRTPEENIRILEQDPDLEEKLKTVQGIMGIEESESPIGSIADAMREDIDSTKEKLVEAKAAKLDAPDPTFEHAMGEDVEPERDNTIVLPAGKIDLNI